MGLSLIYFKVSQELLLLLTRHVPIERYLYPADSNAVYILLFYFGLNIFYLINYNIIDLLLFLIDHEKLVLSRFYKPNRHKI